MDKRSKEVLKRLNVVKRRQLNALVGWPSEHPTQMHFEFLLAPCNQLLVLAASGCILSNRFKVQIKNDQPVMQLC